MSVSHKEILAALEQLPKAEKYYVALSGGKDSVCLLHALVHFAKSNPTNPHLKLAQIEVIHVNHGLSPNADAWADFCRVLCQKFGVVAHLQGVEVESAGKGLEAAAREARYQVFNAIVQEDEILLQGHHLDDQAETVLFRCMRGADISGLAAIPLIRDLEKGKLYRPFLGIPRSSISDYIESNGLSFCEDESNEDMAFDRNYIRHEVLPVLQGRWPAANRALSRVAIEAQETQQFMREWCAEEMENLCEPVDLIASSALKIEVLKNFSMTRQRVLVRYWLEQHAVPQAPEKIFERIWTELISSKQDAQPQICYGDVVVLRYKSALYCLSASELNSDSYNVRVSLDTLLSEGVSFSGGTLRASYADDQENLGRTGVGLVRLHNLVGASEITISSRLGGEKIKLRSEHTSSLKKLYQERKVLPWLRDRLPLVYLGDVLIASLAGFVAEGYSAMGDQNNMMSYPGVIELRFYLA